MTFPPYTVVHAHTDPAHKFHYQDGDGAVDGAALDFDACIENDVPQNTANIVICKVTPSGEKISVRRYDMREVEPGAKADSVTAKQSGRNLILWISYHTSDYNTKRIRVVVEGYLADYPEGHVQLGKEGAFVPPPNPDPAPQPPPQGGYPTVQEIAAEVMRQMRIDFGGNIRQGLEDKARDAIQELGPRGADQYFRDRSYEANESYFGPRRTETPALGMPDPTEQQASADEEPGEEVNEP